MEISAFTEPAIIHEISDVNDQSISIPMGNRIAVVGGVRTLAVCAAIGGDDAVRISRDVFVQENHFSWELNDPARRTDPRNAGLSAIEDFVSLALVVEQVLHLFPEFWFVGRRGSRCHGSRNWFFGGLRCALIDFGD